MRVYRLLSTLLDYPDAQLQGELRAALGEAGAAAAWVDALDAERQLAREERQSLAAFVERLAGADLTEAQADYVQTFDLTPEHSLHLTHHLFGEEKSRGPALIDLSEYYKSYGFAHDAHELPDYLPLILEFVSELSPDEARVFLADAAKVLKVLAANLEEAGSPYAPLVRIVENQGTLTRLAA